ncbi:MAG: hypothetical protein Q9184_006598 [Pyrenodesmia sp. 2 TL-2023]
MASESFGKALARFVGLVDTYWNMKERLNMHPADSGLLRTKINGLIDRELQAIRRSLEDSLTTGDLLQYLPQLTSARRKLLEMKPWVEVHPQLSVLDPIILDIVTASESSTKEDNAGDGCSILPNPSDSGILTPGTEIETGAKAVTGSKTETETEIDEPLAPEDNLFKITCVKVEYLVDMVEKLAITHQNTQALTGRNGNRTVALSHQLELPESVQDSELHRILQQLLALDEKFQASGIQCSEVQGLIALCIRWLGNYRP